MKPAPPVMKNFCIVFNEVSYGKLESGSRVENNRLARQRANVIGDGAEGNNFPSGFLDVHVD